MTEIYTTGRIAKMFNASPRTVSKWIDTGLLRGYRIPGSQDRRVTRRALQDFVRRHPFDPDAVSAELLEVLPVVLLVGCEPGAFAEAEDFELVHAPTAFEAGRLFAERRPSVVVLDVQALGSLDVRIIARSIGPRVPVVELPDSSKQAVLRLSVEGPDPAARTESIRGHLAEFEARKAS